MLIIVIEQQLKNQLFIAMFRLKIYNYDPYTLPKQGPASYFLVIETRKELAQVLAWLQEEALPWFFLGNGSNLLVGDRGYRGAILHLAGEFLKTEIDEATIRCGAGAMRCV